MTRRNEQWAPVSNPPFYCRQCGQDLEERTSVIAMGYDAYTGLANPGRDHITKVCPVPAHDVWVLNDERDAWIRT